MVAKAENGHVNVQELFKFNLIATNNIRSPEKDSEKNMVLCKKVTTLPHLTGTYIIVILGIKSEFDTHMKDTDPDPK